MRMALLVSMSAALLCVSAGCTGPTINQTNDVEFVSRFFAGEVVLDRNNPVALPPPWKVDEFKRLWLRQDWPVLARAVAEQGYDEDLLWFYLGEAASASGHRDAALIYYKMAVDDSNSRYRTRHCSIFSNTVMGSYYDACAGFTFPRDALARIQATSR